MCAAGGRTHTFRTHTHTHTRRLTTHKHITHTFGVSPRTRTHKCVRHAHFGVGLELGDEAEVLVHLRRRALEEAAAAACVELECERIRGERMCVCKECVGVVCMRGVSECVRC